MPVGYCWWRGRRCGCGTCGRDGGGSDQRWINNPLNSFAPPIRATSRAVQLVAPNDLDAIRGRSKALYLALRKPLIKLREESLSKTLLPCIKFLLRSRCCGLLRRAAVLRGRGFTRRRRRRIQWTFGIRGIEGVGPRLARRG